MQSQGRRRSSRRLRLEGSELKKPERLKEVPLNLPKGTTSSSSSSKKLLDLDLRPWLHSLQLDSVAGRHELDQK